MKFIDRWWTGKNYLQHLKWTRDSYLQWACGGEGGPVDSGSTRTEDREPNVRAESLFFQIPINYS